MRRLQPYQRTADLRGDFLGLTQEPWAEINLVTTRAGQTRGNHYHTDTIEMFCVLSGRISVEVESVLTGEKTAFDAGAGDLFVIEPFDLHTFRTHSDSSWLNMLSRPFDPEHPDFHRPEPQMKETA
jgi:dTDP-4-dehydrorhamnose 3,5-epimerase-like enzyme